MKVYIVTEGEYSAYHICAVFTDKEVADQHAKDCGGNVNEYEVDNALPRKILVYEVYVDAFGNEIRRLTNERWSYEPKEDERAFISRYPYIALHAYSERGYDVALKIARDELAEMKARNAGL